MESSSARWLLASHQGPATAGSGERTSLPPATNSGRRLLFTESSAILIQSSLEAAPHLKLIAYCFGSTTTHLHALLGWRDLREEEQVRRKLKEALTRRLNGAFERRAWFVREGWCSSVEDDEHFGHLVETYLPSHPGWFWSRRAGWRGPRIG